MRNSISYAIQSISEKTLYNDKLIKSIIRTSTDHTISRKALLKLLDKTIYNYAVKKNADNLAKEAALNKYYMGRALVKTLSRLYEEDKMSQGYKDNLLNVIVGNNLVKGLTKKRELLDSNIQQPFFLLIDPTSICNLDCEYCYADAGNRGRSYKGYSFPYRDLTRIMDEAQRQLDINFFVFSGGEPTMWQGEDEFGNKKNIADIFEEYNDTLFLMYTNGTALDKLYAKKHNLPDDLIERFARSGNVIPCLSKEGKKEDTDKRRGKADTEDLSAIVSRVARDLKEAGVPFLYSVTITSKNADYVGSAEFHDKNLEEGAMGEWNFHVMPIGRIWNKDGQILPKDIMDLLVQPEQRNKLYEDNWKYVRDRGVFIGDFWNAGSTTANIDCPAGCIAAGRTGGHFTIRANGKITPCVFLPLCDKKLGNIYDVWEQGKSLEDIIHCDLFERIREEIQKVNKNYKLPCSIRDNFELLQKIVDDGVADYFDEGTKQLFENPELASRFIQNSIDCKAIMKP